MSNFPTNHISAPQKAVRLPSIMGCLLLFSAPLLAQTSQGSGNPQTSPPNSTGFFAWLLQILHALPPLLTAIIIALFWWLTAHLLMRAFFSPPSIHAPLAARIGLWIGTVFWLVSIIWVVLPAYTTLHILSWHILAGITFLACFGALLFTTSPKAPGRLNN